MKYFFIILTIVFIEGAGNNTSEKNDANISIPPITLETTDPLLHFKNGYWLYKEKLFSGFITERYPGGSVHYITSYFNGKEEGKQLAYFNDHTLAEQRLYHAGEKDGIHTGWWPNGNKRFEYHFKNGIYEGDFKEWYQTGEPLQYIHYTNGVDDRGKGWRLNGKLYMNFVVKDGRRYGLNNSNLCYAVKNGNGGLIASVGDTSYK